MTSKAKIKGNSWEREIASFLSLTLGGNFQRVANSGAFIGRSNSHRKLFMEKGQIRSAKGDIVPPDSLPKLNLEAKSYADIAFAQILLGSCKQLDNWIEQTEEPADEGDISFTIFKITRKGSWVVFREELAKYFRLGTFTRYVKNANGNSANYVITDFKSFFEENKEAVKSLAK